MNTGLYDIFEAYMKSITPPVTKEALVAGVSGGADSVCLLRLLHEFGKESGCRLICVHVNHGIRGAEADRDESFVKELCDELGNIVYEAFHENIPEYAARYGMTSEEAGRKRRYEIFADTCRKYGSSRLFVAHNAGDTAETMLFNLFRGSSVLGLAGIRDEAELAKDSEIRIYRPLLSVKRDEIEAFLKEQGSTWCTDSTNLGNDYSRNRIRNIILPEAEKINAGALSHICEAAADIGELYGFFMAEADRLEGRLLKDGELSLTGFTELAPYMQRELAYRLICLASGRKKDIGRKHVAAAVSLAKGESGKSINLPYGLVLKKEYDRLFVLKDENKKLTEPFVFEPAGLLGKTITASGFRISAYQRTENTELTFGDKNAVFFDFDRVLAEGSEAALRTAEENDWFCPYTDGRKKSISRLFIDRKTGSAERESIVLFAIGSHVLWIPGIRNDESFRIDENTVRILEVRRDKGE